jgi:hypothetical protein
MNRFGNKEKENFCFVYRLTQELTSKVGRNKLNF